VIPAPFPALKHFRIEPMTQDYARVVFDMHDRSMNVFSNAAIGEIEAVADWLPNSGLKGVLVVSGKASAFCAGADLGELGQAYSMIMGAPQGERTNLAARHFGPLGRAFRKLETAGVPVAVALAGLALGGGGELALAGHYRVMTTDAVFGLPETLVGLFPGAGGTQRLPRLIGLERSLPVLLHGARFTAEQALECGLADAVVLPGKEEAEALAWLKTGPEPRQPWDRKGHVPASAAAVGAALTPWRGQVLCSSAAHQPAMIATLDCIEHGLSLPMDGAIAAELAQFAVLIQRPEPRDMIRTLFLGRTEFDKRRKAGSLPASLDDVVKAVAYALGSAAYVAGANQTAAAEKAAGFDKPIEAREGPQPDTRALPETSFIETRLWFEAPLTQGQILGARLIGVAAAAVAPYAEHLNDSDKRVIDLAILRETGFPAYLGGPFALINSIGGQGVRKLLS
jgi:3-hydroxyacyl-CoA dehydrogenase / enoyl-CoA hydratase / 3-hydroxybutyryl-CoA epimerase